MLSRLFKLAGPANAACTRDLLRATVLLCIVLLTTAHAASGQSRAQARAAQRYEIDAKRAGAAPGGKDALPRSREYIRIDSSYYVGYLFEGVYKSEHAADYQGFKMAAIPLERALYSIERDYSRELRTRTKTDYAALMSAFPRWQDYATIVTTLNNCYLNTEDAEKSYALCRRYISWNLQVVGFDAYNYLMWVTHRNRFYTRSKYSFLGNSIDENEALASRYLDTMVRSTLRNRAINDGVLVPGYDQPLLNSVLHYRAILYTYALNIDSADLYYRKLENTGLMSHNNYANYQSVIGKFRKADEEYRLASSLDGADKRLQEWVYYSSILDIYRGMPKKAEGFLRDYIRGVGSTPGFGWYNIALSRALFYDGQIGESERFSDKAAEFKELHIGTTLGQSHYDFSIQLEKLLQKEARWEMQKFNHRNWWYNPGVLATMSGLLGERYLQQYLIINQFAENPERDRVIYKIFSTESTVSWDEVWFLIRDFSTNFFTRRFQRELTVDKRPEVRRYFQLFIARLKMKAGAYSEAYDLLRGPELLGAKIDAGYEKLFTARVYEALARCADELDKDAERDQYLYAMYTTYPQLCPFDGMQHSMRLQVSGTADEKAVSRLKACNLRLDGSAGSAPTATLAFSMADGKHLVEYSVIDAGGRYIVPRQKYSYTDSETGGLSLAYRLFGIGGQSPRSEEEAI